MSENSFEFLIAQLQTCDSEGFDPHPALSLPGRGVFRQGLNHFKMTV